MPDQILRYHLRALPNYLAKKPVIIGFTLENLTEERLWVLTWYTPLEGLNGKIFTVTCNGKELLYEGRMVKRGDPVRGDYIEIGPGGQVSVEVDLSSAYNLPICNECQVKFGGQIYDVVNFEDRIPKKRDEYKVTDISGNTVVFHIVNP